MIDNGAFQYPGSSRINKIPLFKRKTQIDQTDVSF